MALVTNEPVNPPDGTIITADLADDSVSDGKLRESAALSVIGRSANSTGNPADIAAAAASGAVLREASNVLGFGTIATAGIADAAVTSAKLRNSAAVSVIGRSANSSGVPADIAAGSDLQYFGRRSSALGFFALNEDDLGGVISRQTLGADAQDVTFAVADTDESIEIIGYGNAASASATIQVNGGGTAVTYSNIANTNGGAPTGNSSNVFATYDGPAFFILQFAIKNLGLHRIGTCTAGVKSTGSATKDQYRCVFIWPDAAANVTSIVLHSSVATGWKSGFLFICRRRKFT